MLTSSNPVILYPFFISTWIYHCLSHTDLLLSLNKLANPTLGPCIDYLLIPQELIEQLSVIFQVLLKSNILSRHCMITLFKFGLGRIGDIVKTICSCSR